jgi:cyclase
MSLKRLIPVLLINGESLIKTERFKNPKYIGDPINAVKIFNEKEVDELAIIDIFANKEKRKPNFDLLQQITNECFMPLMYGGGVQHLSDFERLFRMGIEKVLVNRLIFEKPDVVRQAIDVFGSQSIVASLDLKKTFWTKNWQPYNYLKSKFEDTKSLELMLTMLENDLKVGEIFVNLVDHEGTWCGLDLDLIQAIRSKTKLPLIISGGAKSIEEIKHVFEKTEIDAIGIGAMSVYQGKGKGILINFPNPNDIF